MPTHPNNRIMTANKIDAKDRAVRGIELNETRGFLNRLLSASSHRAGMGKNPAWVGRSGSNKPSSSNRKFALARAAATRLRAGTGRKSSRYFRNRGSSISSTCTFMSVNSSLRSFHPSYKKSLSDSFNARDLLAIVERIMFDQNSPQESQSPVLQRTSGLDSLA